MEFSYIILNTLLLERGGGVLPKQKGLCPRDSLGGMFKFQIDWYSKLYFN